MQVCSLTIEYGGLPTRAKFQHFRTIWEHTFDDSPTDFISSSLKWWASRHCWVLLFANSQYRSTHFLAWPSMSVGHEEILRFPELNNFPLLLRNFRIQTWFCNRQQYLCLFHIVFECTRFSISRKDVGSPKSTSVLSTFHIGLMSSTYTDKNNPSSLCTNKHSQLETFSHPYFNRTFSNCLSHNSSAKGWP